MKSYANYLSVLGILSLIGCGSEGGSTGPENNDKENPFKGKWAYVKYVEFANDGLDTVDYTEEYKTYSLVFHDSTGRRIIPSRPTSALDSLHYKYNADSIFTTSFVDNFLNYQGRPYEFKGKDKDTLDFSDPDHIEVLVRAN